MSAPTEKMAKILKKYGKDPDCSFEEASEFIDDIASKGWPATEKQKAKLDEYGYETEGVSSKDASEIIDEIAAAGWPDPSTWTDE